MACHILERHHFSSAFFEAARRTLGELVARVTFTKTDAICHLYYCLISKNNARAG
jgi:hypothetical protein